MLGTDKNDRSGSASPPNRTSPSTSPPHAPAPCGAGMLDPDEKDTEGKAFAARTVFIVGPEQQLKLALLYPSSTGRNFSEVGEVCAYLSAADSPTRLGGLTQLRALPTKSARFPVPTPPLHCSCCVSSTRFNWRPSTRWVLLKLASPCSALPGPHPDLLIRLAAQPRLHSPSSPLPSLPTCPSPGGHTRRLEAGGQGFGRVAVGQEVRQTCR